MDHYSLSEIPCGRGIRTCMDTATSPSIAMYVILTYCATEASPKKKAEIAQLKVYGHHRTLRLQGSFLYLLLYKFVEL